MSGKPSSYAQVMSEAKLCSRCGGPEETGDRFCRFCGVSFLTDEQKNEEERVRAKLSLDQVFAKLEAPVSSEAITRSVVAAFAIVASSEASGQSVANAVVKLTTGFAKEKRVEVDAQMVRRVFDAYVKARAELRREPSVELNLPFLAAGPGGPVHMVMALTRDDVARLEA